MCMDPATLSTVSTWLSGVGTVVAVAGVSQQAKATSNAYEYQAKVNEKNATEAARQAQDASDRGFQAEQELRRKAGAFGSTQKSLLAGQGTDITSGNPLDVLSNTAYQSEQDAAAIRYNAQLEKYGHLSQSQDLYGQAAMNQASAGNARTAGRWGAAGSLLTGAATVSDKWSQYQRNYPKKAG